VRRLTTLAIIAVTAVGAITGCGSSKSGSRSAASTPRLQALSYFPATSPFVLTAETASTSRSTQQLQTLERRFPTYSLAATALFAELAKLNINYNQDVRPLFGNPIVFGLVGTTDPAGSHRPPFLAAWVTKSASRLAALIGKLPTAHATGTDDGAKLYSLGTLAAAVSGPTIIAASSPLVLRQALARQAQGQGFTAAEYAEATTGIAPNGAVEMFGDLTGVLSAPSDVVALRVPWVAALRGYGASVTAGTSGVTMQFHLDTTGRSLSPSELPIASGSSSAGVAGTLPIQAGVRDPAQIINFVLDTIKQTDPTSAARLTKDEAAVQRRTGIDIAAQADLLSGSLNVESDTHTTLARVAVSDPASVRTLLSKLTQPGSGPKGRGLTPLGGGFYSITASKPRVTVGLVGGELLVGKATPTQLRAFLSAPASGATGATGAVTFRVGLAQVIALTLKRAPSSIEEQLLGMLGDLTGSASATTGGMTGTVTLGLR
jgi:hypothetical protein